jgi:5-(carboxyamino)imidazole ribonucleotide synthase
MNTANPDRVKTIGILGSGQLGRMLAIAAAQLGIRSHIYAPDAANSPAGDIAHQTTTASYDDTAALAAFAATVDAVTSEFENVPAEVMATLGADCAVSPGEAALHTAQHRIREKTLARKLGIETPKFWPITSSPDLKVAMQEHGRPCILKTCTLGYDGKGQVRIKPTDDLDAAFASLGTDDAILEEMVDFTAEASFLVARNAAGDTSHFPASLNHHHNGILARSTAPAPLPDEIIAAGQQAVAKFATALDLLGVLALEAFVTDDGRLLFNEIAPRPHNSFHWTIEGCATSQFSQLARLLVGMPFGATHSYGQWQMDNLLGEDMPKLPGLVASTGVHVHLYGKAGAKTGRKMGHTNQHISD